METKPIHVKPSLYAYLFHDLKVIALKYGYNLVLHGSMKRDLDLIAIPWQAEIKSHTEMVSEFAEKLGGDIQLNQRRVESGKLVGDPYSTTHHGRMHYVINLNREFISEDHPDFKEGYQHDAQYYLDISVIPILKNLQL